FCAARREGLTGVLPVRAEKKRRRAEERTVFVLLRDGTLAVRRRPDTGLLAKLNELPNTAGSLDEASARVVLAQWGLTAQTLTPLGTAKHIFTHIEWQMKGYAAVVTGDAPALQWVDAAAFEALAIPTAFQFYTAQAREWLQNKHKE
nr:NUDIX domain-containing protein [Oscillospiraceae bacterium]